MSKEFQTSGIVLTGGKSARMGCNKASLTIKNKSLLEHVISSIDSLCNEIIIVSSPLNNLQKPVLHSKVRIVNDIYPNKGPLAGIHAGLSASNSDLSLVVACDMPFLQRDLLRYMISISTEYDAVIPRIGNFAEPLHAIYNKNCLAVIEELLNRGVRKISELFCLVKVRYLGEHEIHQYDPKGVSFFNINTKKELELFITSTCDHK